MYAKGMSSFKMTLLLLTLVHATAAFDAPPFTWKALEEAERQAVTAASKVYSDSMQQAVKLQQAVKERVFADTSQGLNEQDCNCACEQSAPQESAQNVAPFLFTLLALPFTFLVGWFGGMKHMDSVHAMQQAKIADQAEADAIEQTAALEAAANSVALPSEAVLQQTDPDADLKPQLQDHHDSQSGCLISNQWSSPDDSDHNAESQQEDIDSSAGSVSHTKNDLGQHQSTPAAGQVDDMAAADVDVPSEQDAQHATQQPTEEPSRSTNSHLSPQQLPSSLQQSHKQDVGQLSASSPAMRTGIADRQLQASTNQESDFQSQQASAALDVGVRLVDMIHQRLGINRQTLQQQQKLDLTPSIMQGMGIYANMIMHQESHRLKMVSNQQGADHNEILREGQRSTQAWRQAKEEQKQLQLFFERLADCLTCGLLVMLAGMLYWGVTLGYFRGRLSECGSRRTSLLISVWKPWQWLVSLQTMWCYAAATSDVIGSAVLMLVVPVFVRRHKLLSNSMAQPMTGLVLGLGVVGGCAGKFVVGQFGGDGPAWLSMYWIWVTLHVLSAYFVADLYRSLTSRPKCPVGLCQELFDYAKLPLFCTSMAVMLPLTIAMCPFWHLLGQELW